MKYGVVLEGEWDLYHVLGSQYQSIDWTQQTTCQVVFQLEEPFKLMEPRMRKLHTRPAMTWSAVSTFIRTHQGVLGNSTNE